VLWHGKNFGSSCGKFRMMFRKCMQLYFTCFPFSFLETYIHSFLNLSSTVVAVLYASNPQHCILLMDRDPILPRFIISFCFCVYVYPKFYLSHFSAILINHSDIFFVWQVKNIKKRERLNHNLNINKIICLSNCTTCFGLYSHSFFISKYYRKSCIQR